MSVVTCRDAVGTEPQRLPPTFRPFQSVAIVPETGGAVATHVRVGSPLFSHELFGVYLGVLLLGRTLPAQPAHPSVALFPFLNRPGIVGGPNS
jgi:hypothetical protein